MSDGADIVAKRRAAELQRLKDDEARRLREMADRLLPLAVAAAANLQRLDYPDLTVISGCGKAMVEVIDGKQRVTWGMTPVRRGWEEVVSVRLVDDGSLLGLTLDVNEDGVASLLHQMAIYPDKVVEPAPPKPKRRSFGKWLHDWLQAEGIIR